MRCCVRYQYPLKQPLTAWGEQIVSFDGEIILTEKVDGTNSRIVLLPDGNFVLGSTEENYYLQEAS